MRDNKFSHYSLSHDSKRTAFDIKSFLGVDFNPAQMQVATNHAVDIQNFIYKDRVNQKRSGWEQVTKVAAHTYYVENDDGTFTQKTNTTNFNGLWNLNGNIIAHIGRLLFIIKNIDSFLDITLTPFETVKYINQDSYNVALELEDYKSQAFIQNNKLYILAGNDYLVLKVENDVFTVKSVEDDENTYVPTTTIGITYKDSPVSGAAVLDDVNMLTQMRKNKLVSGTYFDDGVSLRTTRFWDYELDTNIKGKKPTDINNVKVVINSLKEVA